MGKHLFLVVICLIALDLRAQSSLWDRPSDTDYVDLGLPSGVMWCAGNASGFCSYYEVFYQFGSQVPSLQDWRELEKKCKWVWTGSGYTVTGPNGNSITLPAEGGVKCGIKGDREVFGVGTNGCYWFYHDDEDDEFEDFVFLSFSSDRVGLNGFDDDCSRYYSVRLVKHKPQPNAASVSFKVNEGDYVDLGLASGTKWCGTGSRGMMSYDKAHKQYSDHLPSKEQWEELMTKCKWSWTDGVCTVTGPNGKSITLREEGFIACRGRGRATSCGCYWSSTTGDSYMSWSLYFAGDVIKMRKEESCIKMSVLLVLKK